MSPLVKANIYRNSYPHFPECSNPGVMYDKGHMNISSSLYIITKCYCDLQRSSYYYRLGNRHIKYGIIAKTNITHICHQLDVVVNCKCNLHNIAQFPCSKVYISIITFSNLTKTIAVLSKLLCTFKLQVTYFESIYSKYVQY